MAEKDVFAERGRSLEDDYFRRKDRELIEKMKAKAAADEARREMEARTGLTDPDLLRELQELGFSPDTVALLPLVPAVQMAWAEGGITPAERKMLIELARSRGIAHDTPADQLLHDWLADRPDDSVFARATRLIRAMLSADQQQSDLTADDLVKYCESIASASGGILGIGKISAEERALLSTLAAELRTRHG